VLVGGGVLVGNTGGVGVGGGGGVGVGGGGSVGSGIFVGLGKLVGEGSGGFVGTGGGGELVGVGDGVGAGFVGVSVGVGDDGGGGGLVGAVIGVGVGVEKAVGVSDGALAVDNSSIFSGKVSKVIVGDGVAVRVGRRICNACIVAVAPSADRVCAAGLFSPPTNSGIC
jgi:hypothetical protein